MRLLGVLLCYNDGDFVEEAVSHLLDQGHQVIAWDHGSDDDTASILNRLAPHLLELETIPREFDFYGLYQEMSRNLLANHCRNFDWISWPDQDEILEGPDRTKSYRAWLETVFESESDWIQFWNFNFWFTSEDDPTEPRATRRVRRYSIFPDCAPRIRSWRASATNIRQFNHNEPLGQRWPEFFCLRHYPARSREKMVARVLRDRAGLRRGDQNYHYENIRSWLDRIDIPASALHLDDGISELSRTPVFNWRTIYGNSPEQRSAADPG